MHGYTQTGKMGELLKQNIDILGRRLLHISNIGELNFGHAYYILIYLE